CVIGRFGFHYASPTAPFAFMLIFAALYQLEVIVTTARKFKPAAGKLDATAQPGVAFSLLVTAALTGGMLWLLKAESEVIRGTWTVAFAAATCLVGFTLPKRKYASLAPLAIGYRVQAAVLIVVAVPILLHGWSVIAGWAALAIGFSLLGAICDLSLSRRAGALTWLLAALYLIQWTVNPANHAPREVWLSILHTPIPAYLVMSLVLTIVAQLIAIITQLSRKREAIAEEIQQLTWLMSLAGGILWIVMSIAALPTLGATFAMVAYAWLLFIGDLVQPRPIASPGGLVQQSAAVLVLATLKWVVIDNLADRIAPGWSAANYTPILNPIMAMGVLISASLCLIAWIRREVLLRFLRRENDEDAEQSRLVLLVMGFVLVMMSIGLSFEIDRIVENVKLGAALAWPSDQAKHLAWSMLWSASFAGLMALTRRLEPNETTRRESLRRLAVFPMLLAMKFLIVDTLGFRIDHRPADVLVVANLQALTALFVFGGLALSWLFNAPREKETSHRRGFVGFLALLVMLWTGTLEIDRWATYQWFGNPWFVRQVGFSIFWSIFAIACVGGGFRARVAPLRYFGLTLFAITLLKVVLVDLGQISTGYRVLSFMGLGVLLLGTSVLYGKLSPRLLETGRESAN
ncbi:MAG TPA: DUF2339 domain-containing protein, partial [Tepidisphaeraceae bacterium]|nr:DUF2339 domain-containing protein [Tepidisphaeraceae bacterium]